MKTIYFNNQGSFGGGGPSVWVAKTAIEFIKRGYKVIYDKPSKADAAICIIETGKVLKQIDRSKTKVIVRIDGIYNKLYNEKFNRAIRPDMIALHAKLKSDIPTVDYVVYQSSWSKDRIDEEIVKRQDNSFSIINNGVDINLFKPVTSLDSKQIINIIHVGKMRDGYLMEMLVGTLKELRVRGHKVRLSLAGTMDAECSKIFNANKSDDLRHLGSFPNTNLSHVYNLGDVYLGPRQGSSCDNVIPEAQACGLPVLIPSWGGNKDMVVNGSTGIVVDGGEWDYDHRYINSLSDGFELIIQDLDGFKVRARQHAVNNLSISAMVDKYCKIIG